jgi:hypothetical protein
VDPLTVTRAPWFYWPGTFGVVATVAAVHLYLVGGDGPRPSQRRLAVATAAFFSVLVAVVPLKIGVYAVCADGTHGLRYNVVAGSIGIAGVVVWLAVVWRLYMAVGMGAGPAQRPPVVLGIVATAGMVVEFLVSTVSVEGYCAYDDRSRLFGHAVGALALCLVAAAAVAGRHRRSSTLS